MMDMEEKVIEILDDPESRAQYRLAYIVDLCEEPSYRELVEMR